MEKIWILVADSAHARILSATARTAMPTEITRMEHAESRLKESELTSDQPGRSHEPLDQGHGMQETKAREQEEKAFAAEIIKTLDKARQSGQFDSLILVASPHFLGVLRQRLTGPLEKSVIQSVDKNLVNESESVIHQHIFN